MARSTLKSARTTLWLVAALLVVSCGGKAADKAPESPATAAATDSDKEPVQVAAPEPAKPTLPEIPAAPAPRPKSILAWAQIGNPNADFARAGALADAITPGAGAMFDPKTLTNMAPLLNFPAPRGIDFSKPISYIMLNPKEFEGGVSGVIIVGVADEAELRDSLSKVGELAVIVHDGFASIGSVKAQNELAAFALTTFIQTAPVQHPTAVVYPSDLLDSFSSEIEQLVALAEVASGGSGGAEAEALSLLVANGVAFARQTPELSLSIDPKPTGLDAWLSFAAEPGSQVASFYGAQKPSDYRLLPMAAQTGDALYLAAGSIDWKPLSKVMAEFVAVAGKMGGGAAWTPELMDKALKAFSDEFAMTMSIDVDASDPKFEMAMLWKVKDAKAAEAVMAALDFSQGSDKIVVKRKKRRLRFKGVSLDEIRTKLAPGVSAAERATLEPMTKLGPTYVGVGAGYYFTTMGKSAKKAARTLISAVKRKKPASLSAEVSAQIEASKKLGESMVFLIGLEKALGSVVPLPMALGFAFKPDGFKVRWTASVETLKAMQ